MKGDAANRPSGSDAPRCGIELAAWSVALAGIFGPWVAHSSAALAWNAFDLFDILRILPEIETLALTVNLYTLRLPLVGLALLLPFLVSRAHVLWRLGAAALSALLLVNTLPPYDLIRSAWHTPGWRVPFWWGVGGLLALGVLTALNLRQRGGLWRNPRLSAWTMLLWALLTGIPAFITFPRLLPALERLLAAPVAPGWGFWTCGAGLLVLGIRLWVRGITPGVQRQEEVTMKTQTEPAEKAASAAADTAAAPQEAAAPGTAAPGTAVEDYEMEYQHVRTVKERYEQELLAKANVVGVGIGLRSTVTRSEAISLIVNVTHKTPLKALRSADRIPDELEGVPVKVEAIGQPSAQAAAEDEPAALEL